MAVTALHWTAYNNIYITGYTSSKISRVVNPITGI